jgi:hypothetical protein
VTAKRSRRRGGFIILPRSTSSITARTDVGNRISYMTRIPERWSGQKGCEHVYIQRRSTLGYGASASDDVEEDGN